MQGTVGRRSHCTAGGRELEDVWQTDFGQDLQQPPYVHEHTSLADQRRPLLTSKIRSAVR